MEITENSIDMQIGRKTFHKLIASIFFALLLIPAGVFVEGKPPEPQSLRVLFIGNSYTYFNNLPEIFAKLAESGRQATVETRMEAPGGWRLKDHWEKGEAPKTLRDGKWDYVVLQEQSTLGFNLFVEGRPRIVSDEFFEPYAVKWASEIRKAGATPVFYLTWARKTNPEDQAALNYAYVHAANESGAQVAPVGIAWTEVRQEQPAIELYMNDGSHPSPAGTYLAGCTLYASIFHQSPVGLPGKISGIPINPNTAKEETGKIATLVDLPADPARALQTAAWNAWQKLKENGGYLKVSPVSMPSLPPLPIGLQLSSIDLEGTWSGNLLLYPPPYLPTEMVLQMRRDNSNWRGRLKLSFHSANQPDRSFDLGDLRLDERELTFTDPTGMPGLKVHFRGVSPRSNELQGTAEATRESPDSPVRLLGTWKLRRK